MTQICNVLRPDEIGGNKVLLNEEGVVPNRGKTSDSTWCYDTSASNHMTGSRSALFDLDESVKGRVRFGDGSVTEICGRGSVLFECKNGEHFTLTEVYLIPKLQSNIISLG